MNVQFGVAKINKYATSESGDTLEMIERPHGGLSLVLVDGQRSGRAAKLISNVVARKAIQLLAEGVRDGAAARAAHDYLFTYRGGKVSATLNIVSIDTHSRTIVISRNNEAPVLLHTPHKGVVELNAPSEAVGVHRNTKPVITEVPIELGTVVVAFTDGLRHAGRISGTTTFDVTAVFRRLLTEQVYDAQRIANILLDEAMGLAQGRPNDDISVMVVSVRETPPNEVRRLSGNLPLRV
ncbi:MAG: serine/threonine-protein phosphatase [Anaerolineales bacterium]|nr:serine/threonine-protein phosphatase [Anaerolineales bacterium]MCB8953367.1 serine/threonine-protein phosphatase [Ardenticatenales bacterium]